MGEGLSQRHNLPQAESSVTLGSYVLSLVRRSLKGCEKGKYRAAIVVQSLTEERAHGGLSVWWQACKQLLGVQTGGPDELASCSDYALSHGALKSFGLEGLGDRDEALCGFGVNSRVGPA